MMAYGDWSTASQAPMAGWVLLVATFVLIIDFTISIAAKHIR